MGLPVGEVSRSWKRNRRPEEKLGVRIGVSLGDTTFEDGTT